jgi:hypothetical protein
MTYRNDVDALAAREAALAKELAAKAKERDEVGRLLAEAKAKEAAETKPRVPGERARVRRGWMSVLIWEAFLVPGLVGYAVLVPDKDESVATTTPTASDESLATTTSTSSGRVYTCDEIRPDYDKANAQTAQAYAAALAQQDLVPANLEEVQLGGGWSGGPMTREELDKPLAVSPEAWTVIDYKQKGTKRRALVGDVVEAGTMYAAEPVELVADAHGGIWKVVRMPRARTLKTVDVDACPGWGCFGSPPPGAMPPPVLSRRLYLLPAGATYRGTIEISYDAPQLLMNNIKDDPMGACSPPG